MNTPKIGLGILSWRAHETIRKTLSNYNKNGLFELFDQTLIYFNDLCDEDRSIAEEAGIPYEGGANSGIFGGMKALAHHLKEMDYILFLQNDCPAAVDHDAIKHELDRSIGLLQSGTADVVRMRHRWQVGEGFDLHKYLRYFGISKLNTHFNYDQTGIRKEEVPETLEKKIRRLLRPGKAKKLLGMSVYLEENPELLYPYYIRKIGETFIIDSSVIPFTEQSFLIGKEFMSQLFDFVDKNPRKRTLNGFQSMEIALNVPFWGKGGFKTGISTGVFTHNRFDGSFRENHPAYKGH
jgi:hypothetical protein